MSAPPAPAYARDERGQVARTLSNAVLAVESLDLDPQLGDWTRRPAPILLLGPGFERLRYCARAVDHNAPEMIRRALDPSVGRRLSDSAILAALHVLAYRAAGHPGIDAFISRSGRWWPPSRLLKGLQRGISTPWRAWLTLQARRPDPVGEFARKSLLRKGRFPTCADWRRRARWYAHAPRVPPLMIGAMRAVREYGRREEHHQ